MASYIFSILYKLIYFSLPLNPGIHRMGNTPNTLCPRCKEQKELQAFQNYSRLYQWTNQCEICF